MSKTTITRAQSAAFAAELFGNPQVVDALYAIGYAPEVVEAHAAIMGKLAATLAKPAKASDPDGLTATARKNAPIMRAVLTYAMNMADAGEPTEDDPARGCVTSNMVRDAVADVMTTQKAVKLCGSLIDLGAMERVRVGSKVYYRAVTDEITIPGEN